MMSATYRVTIDDRHEVLSFRDPSPTAADPAQRGTEFRPVSGGDNIASGETLLVEAYAVLWVILFAFLWISWRKQARIDTRISELERSLASARGAKLP